MILAILGVCVLVFIACAIAADKSVDFGELFCILGGLCVIAAAICIVATLVLGICVSNLATVDDRIAMYEEQNAKIEAQISDVVEQYMDYESGVFTEVSSESAITLVSLYPELKADTLVASQIELYMTNNQKIIELREKQINGSVLRWWLYFGG